MADCCVQIWTRSTFNLPFTGSILFGQRGWLIDLFSWDNQTRQKLQMRAHALSRIFLHFSGVGGAGGGGDLCSVKP